MYLLRDYALLGNISHLEIIAEVQCLFIFYFTSLFCVREFGIHRETGTWHRNAGTSLSLFPVAHFFL